MGLAAQLRAHHRRCKKVCLAAEQALARADWSAFAACAAALRNALLGHFVFEEEELFPEFERITGLCEATRALRDQHGDMRAILDVLVAVAPAHDPEGCRSEFDTLTLMLRQHMEREEQVMYPAFQRTLDRAPDARAAGEADPETAQLDLRGLQPPQPILRIFEALEREPGKPLRAILPHEPLPLYGLLRERGFRFSGAPRADGGFEVLIEPA